MSHVTNERNPLEGSVRGLGYPCCCRHGWHDPCVKMKAGRGLGWSNQGTCAACQDGRLCNNVEKEDRSCDIRFQSRPGEDALLLNASADHETDGAVAVCECGHGAYFVFGSSAPSGTVAGPHASHLAL